MPYEIIRDQVRIIDKEDIRKKLKELMSSEKSMKPLDDMNENELDRLYTFIKDLYD